MIIHIVLYKLKTPPDALEEVKQNIITALKNVPGPLYMELSAPLLPERAKGFNFGLCSRFEDRAALDVYDVSEAHQNVIKNVVGPHVNEVLGYDFDVPDEVDV